MSGTNQILPFAQAANANVENVSSWQSEPTRTTGFVSGTAKSQLFNTAMRQANWMAYVLAQWIVDTASQSVMDDGNYANAKAALTAAINALITTGISAGSFATSASLAAETAARIAADTNEASARATNDSNEVTARTNAITAVYAWAASEFARTGVSYAQTTRQNLTPTADGQLVQNSLNFGNALGGYLFGVGNVNVAGTNPALCTNAVYLNGSLLSTNVSVGSQLTFVTASVPAGTNVLLQQNYTTGSGGGWRQVQVDLSVLFVPF